mmetsp:Transcript_839/g.1519  ORF Transcript_839/g.1519 Transcript_839/m.1519 type:complete len:811 (-) Transcript_839:574-3006(-)|eukprot:CAMPEP_0118633368 /NCGR_PEP_ID=MMETSP0785-20121206/959_1 /TAXON_ID=91992 /ORGANISM="Bolidomonas pacifica, Strain CCMP 1866" /LENGTH=810 /DNA_ID=CAMNT_0006524237 /DNA_START=12 /DNA_END=2444 /DNA_ORIENTATION=-
MSGGKFPSRRPSKLKKKRKAALALPPPPSDQIIDLSTSCGADIDGSFLSPIEVDHITSCDGNGSQVSGLSPAFSKLGKSSGLHLTSEQAAIVALAKGPRLNKGEIIRVRAAAGTGKTTTLQQLVSALASFGHKKLSYVTFNKSAAQDAERRFVKDPTIKATGAVCDCRTTHSAAFGAWMNYTDTKLGNPDDEVAIDNLIESTLSEDIDHFLAPLLSDKNLSKQTAVGVRKQVIVYIRKQISNEFLFRACDATSCFAVSKTYYPAKKEHQTNDTLLNKYIPSKVTNWQPFDIPFYVESAKKIWNQLNLDNDNPSTRRRFTFDSVLRNVQLAQLEMNCSALLVDECQDLTECQVDWFLTQASVYKKQVFFVGDINQGIYGFRGAKSVNITKFDVKHSAVADVIDRTLTHSFRFDQNMACAANTILFQKERSPQPDPGYRVTGAGKNKGTIVKQLCLRDVPKYTVLAFGNLTLFAYALTLLVEPQPSQESLSSSQESGKEQQGEPEIIFKPLDQIPKVALMGKGEGSGRGKWRRIFNDVEGFSNLYNGYFEGKNTSKFVDKFPEFRGEVITFDNIAKVVEIRELSRFSNTISLIQKYKEQTMAVVGSFRENILEQNIKEEDADIILSTVHAAKGCEWDNVVVLDDLSPIHLFMPKDIQRKGGGQQHQQSNNQAVKNKDAVREWEFKSESWGDHLNLWYVALTRAKKIMAVPRKFLDLHEALSTWPLSKEENMKKKAEIETEGNSQKSNGSSASKPREAYETSEAMQKEIAYHLCIPWREKEMKFGGIESFKIYENFRIGNAREEDIKEVRRGE